MSRAGPVAAALVVVGLFAALPFRSAPVEPVDHFEEHAPAVIAHGGAQAYAPGDTLPAFELALEQGADTLEMDLQLTADGEVVVIHDGTVDRTTDGAGAVADMTLAELKELDAGHAFEGPDGGYPYRGTGVEIPTLEEVFAAFPDTFLIVELKTDGGPEIADEVAERIRVHDRQGQVAVASFSVEYLQRFRRLLPDVPTNMPEGELRDLYILQLVGLDRWWTPPGELLQVPEVHEGRRVVTAGFADAAHRLGADVQVWTVNEPEDMHRLLNLGVDGS